ncbi:MAG: hypothetical protein VR68_10775 [Peptococcaceae bacterium BRH_c4a]|nr:MAG: hypothetical protein VR68_10775 [Peptococcaceae bacterium BRH_c4a]
MNISRKKILVILFLLMVLALLIQLARSHYIFSIQRNNALAIELDGRMIFNALPEDMINRKERDSYCVLFDSREPNSVVLKDNIIRMIDLMKKDYSLSDISKVNKLDLAADTAIICLKRLSDIPDMDYLMDFAEQGGSVFFATTPELGDNFYKIYRKIGIHEANEHVYTEGITMLNNVMLGSQGLSVGSDFINNTSLTVVLDDRCRLHAESLDKIPLLWDVPYGKGKIVVFNGTMLNVKGSRGLIAGTLSLLKEDYLYPIMNFKVVFIDDFPAPFPEGYIDSIYKEYGRSTKGFFRDVWWPDILRTGALYDIKYSGMIISSYNNNVKPPFIPKSGQDTTNLILYGRELLKNGGEMGIHGYNHQSLILKGEPMEHYVTSVLEYNVWETWEDIKKSLDSSMQYFETAYKDYVIASYVPPSNVLGPTGRSLLKKSIPDLETIASIYFIDNEADAYVQEFEIAEDGIVEFPRLTYGYTNDDINTWRIINGITSMGIVSHFIHPDDVLDMERNKDKPWSDLSKEFEAFFKKVWDSFPWLRSMTVTGGSREARKFIESRTYIEYESNGIKGYINGFSGESYFILRTGKKASAGENCSVKSIDKGAYIVCAKKSAFSIALSR